MSRCLNPFHWVLGILLLVPELVFGSEGERPAEPVESAVDFSPLSDAAFTAGCCSIVVAAIWSAGLVASARIKRGGDSKCGR